MQGSIPTYIEFNTSLKVICQKKKKDYVYVTKFLRTFWVLLEKYAGNKWSYFLFGCVFTYHSRNVQSVGFKIVGYRQQIAIKKGDVG